MPWCPECKAEYRPEFDTCPECRGFLVYKKPGESAKIALSIFCSFVFYLVLLPALPSSRVFFELMWYGKGGMVNDSAHIAIVLFTVCLFGFVSGRFNGKAATIGIASVWLTYLLVNTAAMLEHGGSDSLTSIAGPVYALAAPPMIAAHLGSRWKRLGIRYFILWIVFTAALVCIPYASPFVWP